MKKRRLDMTTFYTLGIYGLLLTGCLLLVLLGARTYGRTVESQRENDNQRAILSYLSTSIRNHDHENAVAIEQGPEGDMLVMTDEANEKSYVTRIYLSEGELIEEFSRAEADFGQGEKQSIGRCRILEMEWVGDRSLQLRLDEGSVLVSLRSEMGGSQ
ncbi:DUF4860 domain-containing protein [Hominifimenecus sp. rT4P-3]|uniref:DUF4860 domain-containing protein n=1 Tax=Hominifimenecus sp. rT4P-3 TaxID=3242979 RepID=UPI003DA4C86E